MHKNLVKAEYCRNAGLGNKLFSWSRSKIISSEHAFRMIEPIWFSPRGAAITRGGIDYAKALRKIWLFRNFKSAIQHLPFCYNYVYSNASFQPCTDIDEAINNVKTNPEVNIMFRWNAKHDFTDLLTYRKIIKASLLQITLESSKQFIELHNKSPFIGINVRTGKDFVPSGSRLVGYEQTDLKWYINMLRFLRKNGNNEPAIIVSDGGYKQLDLLLKEPNTHLLNAATALEDLLVLSNAKILLGCGNSSFSAWASFLGNMQTYSSDLTSFAHFKLPNTFDRSFDPY
jgi:hypothetical protein